MLDDDSTSTEKHPCPDCMGPVSRTGMLVTGDLDMMQRDLSGVDPGFCKFEQISVRF